MTHGPFRQYLTGRRITSCDRCDLKVETPVLLALVPNAEPIAIGSALPEGWHTLDAEWLCSLACLKLALAAMREEP